jgi:hypothetical protein
MRNKLEENEKKIGITFSINRELNRVINDNYKNKSKYLERLVYQDLLKNKLISRDFIL